MNFKKLYILLSILLFISCKSENKIDPIETATNAFFQTYQQQDDFETFLNFYDEKAVLLDIINGDSVAGKDAISQFFNWNNPHFEMTDSISLVIRDQVFDKNKVVTSGYFTAFKWNGTLFEPMHFTILLEFNEHGKIIFQTDWINYPNSLVDYHDRNNSNSWINPR